MLRYVADLLHNQLRNELRNNTSHEWNLDITIHTSPVIHGHAPNISKLSKSFTYCKPFHMRCDFSYSCDKSSTDRHSALRGLSLTAELGLVVFICDRVRFRNFSTPRQIPLL